MTLGRHLAVHRTARYYVVGEESDAVTDVWFACHGYGQLAADFAGEFECIEEPHRLIVVPEALSRFYLAQAGGFHGPDAKVGATWMTREERDAEISDYIAYLDALYDEVFSVVDRAKVSVTALGFSQGGATANRWVTRGKPVTDRLIMWGCLLASDSDLNEAASFFRKVKLTLVYGTRDKFADSGMIADYEKQLRASSIPYEVATFDGGHRMDRETLRQLAPARPVEADRAHGGS